MEDSLGAWQVTFSPDGTRVAAGLVSGSVRLWTLPPPLQLDLRDAGLWVQVLTWQEMDRNGVLTWLDRATWKARRAALSGGGPPRPADSSNAPLPAQR